MSNNMQCDKILVHIVFISSLSFVVKGWKLQGLCGSLLLLLCSCIIHYTKSRDLMGNQKRLQLVPMNIGLPTDTHLHLPLGADEVSD